MLNTCARITRMAPGSRITTSAATMLFTDDPKTAVKPNAIMMAGNAISASTIRCIVRSTTPPTYALTMPMTVPSVMPISTLAMPTYIEMREP